MSNAGARPPPPGPCHALPPPGPMADAPLVPPLYRDGNVAAHAWGVELLAYWFPTCRPRRIPYASLTRVEVGRARLLASKTWGAGLDVFSASPTWWHWDGFGNVHRAGKPCIIFGTKDTAWRHGATPRGGQESVDRLLSVVRQHAPADVAYVDSA